MSSNIKTVVLMAALTALLVLIGGLLGGRGGMLFAFFFAVVMNLGTWWFSDSIALRMSGAHPVSETEAPELHQIVEMLAQNAGIPKPAVYVINSDTPNAFATGRSPQHAAVAVTSGITRMLNRDELAGVLAHELAHIKHRDTLISAVVATMAGAITMIANWAQWSLLWGGGFGGGRRSNRDNDSGLAIIAGLLMMILAPIAAMMIQMAISRSREFGADAGGARILGNPLPLASALEKMEYGVAHTQPMQVNQAAAHMYIVNPLRAGGMAGLFRTHPPTAERIARLEAMAHHMA